MQFHVRLDRSISVTPEEWGQFGDCFGGILNPLIALGALLLLAIGVRIQNDTLREAREQLKLQQVELQQTRAILQQQSEELRSQAQSTGRQVFEATFFRLLQSIRNLVEGYEISSTSRGITAMFDWAINLRDFDGRRLTSKQCAPDEGAQILQRWYPTHRPRLAPYFSLVKVTLEFIEKSSPPDAIFYADVLQAQLSPGELFLLFHFGAGATGDARLKYLAEKYGLFDNFDPTIFDLPNARRLWYSAPRVPRDYTSRLA